MEQSPKNVTVLDGKDATIVCRAVGAPLPNITWTFGNGKFYSNRKLLKTFASTQSNFTQKSYFCFVFFDIP